MDYDSTPIDATFVAGTNITTINISVIKDDIVEKSETFDLSFSIPSSLSGQVMSGTINKATGGIIDTTSKIILLVTPNDQ